MIFFNKLKTLYSFDLLKHDSIAGILVAIVLIPQAMGYALLAGLPPIIGLYSATFPLIIYALFGSSRHLAVGPVSMISLMVFAICSSVANPGTTEFISLAVILSGLTGIILLTAGLFKLGFIANFISDTVIHGFTSAAAIIIASSQLTALFGINIEKSQIPIETIFRIITAVPGLSLPTTITGICCIVILLFDRYILKKGIGPFVIIALSITLFSLFRLDQFGISIIRDIPKGIPSFTVTIPNISTIKKILPGVIPLAFIGFLESAAIARLMAQKNKYSISANKEMVALGLANISSYFFSGYPVAGGFARTALNESSGAKTKVASIITALIILIIIQFFTSVFYYLPKVALASIVIVAVSKLIHLKRGLQLFKINKADGITFFITFIATLGISIEHGIAIGVIFSLLIFLWRSARKNIIELAVNEISESLMKRIAEKENQNLQQIHIRIESSLFFANIRFFEDFFESRVFKSSPCIVVIDMSRAFCIDASAAKRMEIILDNFHQKKGIVYFLNFKKQNYDLLKQAGWLNKPWFNTLEQKIF